MVAVTIVNERHHHPKFILVIKIRCLFISSEENYIRINENR